MKIRPLKSYPYRGWHIYVLEFGEGETYQCLVSKSPIHHDYFHTEKGMVKKYKEKGGAAIIVSKSAENLIDLFIRKRSIIYKMFGKFLERSDYMPDDDGNDKPSSSTSWAGRSSMQTAAAT